MFLTCFCRTKVEYRMGQNVWSPYTLTSCNIICLYCVTSSQRTSLHLIVLHKLTCKVSWIFELLNEKSLRLCSNFRIKCDGIVLKQVIGTCDTPFIAWHTLVFKRQKWAQIVTHCLAVQSFRTCQHEGICNTLTKLDFQSRKYLHFKRFKHLFEQIYHSYKEAIQKWRLQRCKHFLRTTSNGVYSHVSQYSKSLCLNRAFDEPAVFTNCWTVAHKPARYNFEQELITV